MKRVVAIPLLLILVACGPVSSGAGEKVPGDNTNEVDPFTNTIVFSADDTAGTSQIFSMKPDGSDLLQLTRFLPSEEASGASWSPDGRRIIFSSQKEGVSIGPALWVMNADGSDQQVLYDPEPDNPHVFPLIGHHARWSPDGTKVVFDLCLNCQIVTNYDIYLFDPISKELTRLTDHPAIDLSPAWSPDGEQIAFVSRRDYYDADTLRTRRDIYLMNADGSNKRIITETGYARDPVWSPDGGGIVFRSFVTSNELFQLQLPSGPIVKIEEPFSDELLLIPYSWSDDGEYLLIGTVDYPWYSLHILHVKSGNTISVPHGPLEIQGADWFEPNENES